MNVDNETYNFSNQMKYLKLRNKRVSSTERQIGIQTHKPKISTTVIPCYSVTLYKADFHIKQFFSDHQINPFIFQLIFPQYKVSL